MKYKKRMEKKMKRTIIMFTLSIICTLATLQTFASREAMTAQKAYATLDISPSATFDEIKKAYRKASLKWHPDRNVGNEAAAKQYQVIVAAYELLEKLKKPDTSDRPPSPEQEKAKQMVEQTFAMAKKAYDKGDYASALDSFSQLTKLNTDEYVKGMSNFYIAQIYLIGNKDITKDHKKALDYAKEAFKAGIASAQETIKEIDEAEQSGKKVAQAKFDKLMQYYQANAPMEYIRRDSAIESVKKGDALLATLYKPKGYINPLAAQIDEAVNKRSSSDHLFQEVQSLYLNSIVDIYWAIFAAALNKGFTDGTIVIQDKEDRLFKFLHDEYAKMFNREINSGTAKPQSAVLNKGGCYAYMRTIKKHFPELKDQKGYEQYGLDIRFGSRDKAGDLRPLLPPHGKQHLMFGKVGPELLFLKTEPYGLCGTDAMRSEVPGTEDVPKDVRDEWNKFSKQSKISIGKDPVIKEIYEFIKKGGPNNFYHSIAEHIPETKKAGQDLINYLEKHYDHLDMRRGGETILTQPELLP